MRKSSVFGDGMAAFFQPASSRSPCQRIALLPYAARELYVVAGPGLATWQRAGTAADQPCRYGVDRQGSESAITSQ